MECRETQTLLTAFHDGELPAVERVRVEEHLRGCPECAARLADLARADRAAGVPDPGPAYWDRFNARVMDRVARETDGPRVAVLRPKGGWVRQQLRYLVPAAAAAALVVMVVRYGGMHPGAPTPAVPPAVSERAAPDSAGSGWPRRTPNPTAREGLVPGQAGMPRVLLPRPARRKRRRAVQVYDAFRRRSSPMNGSPPYRGRSGTVRPIVPCRRETRRRRGIARAAPAAIGVPSPPPMRFRGAPAGSPPVTAADGMPSGMQAERKKMAGAAAPMAEQQVAGKATSASGMRVAKEASPGSPCELARDACRTGTVPGSGSRPAGVPRAGPVGERPGKGSRLPGRTARPPGALRRSRRGHHGCGPPVPAQPSAGALPPAATDGAEATDGGPGYALVPSRSGPGLRRDQRPDIPFLDPGGFRVALHPCAPVEDRPFGDP